MSVFSAVIIGVLMGLVFGFLLEKGRVFEPAYIIGQMQLKKHIMVKVFLASVATGLIVISILYGLDLTKLHPKGLIWGADILGGILLGVGIVIAGACPGTILAQIGVGYKDAWVTLIGGIMGAGAYVYVHDYLSNTVLYKSMGKITLADVTGISFVWLALGFAVLIVAGLYMLEKKVSWRDEIGENADGVS